MFACLHGTGNLTALAFEFSPIVEASAPHTVTFDVAGLDRLFGLFTRLNRPIHFDSIDGKPVDLVFLLLIPPTAGSEHLGALAAVARLLRDQEFAARLRKAASATALCDLLCNPRHS